LNNTDSRTIIFLLRKILQIGKTIFRDVVCKKTAIILSLEVCDTVYCWVFFVSSWTYYIGVFLFASWKHFQCKYER